MNTATCSAKEIAAQLTALGFKPPILQVLGAVSKVCRDQFLSDLAHCSSGKDSDGSAHSRIERMLDCTSPEMVMAIEALGLKFSLEDLVAISRKIPVKFLTAVASAANSNHPRNSEAKDFLQELMRSPPSSHQELPRVQPSLPTPPPAEQVKGTSENKGEQNRQKVDQKEFRVAKVYGSGFAICFNAVDGKDGVPGIMVDAAVTAKEGNDWGNATHVMLNVREVCCVLAVFRKWRKSVEFSAHGRFNDKSFFLERQGQNFFCKITSRRNGNQGGVRAVQISAGSAHEVAMLFLEQLLLAYPNLPPSEVIEFARTINSEEIAQRAA